MLMMLGVASAISFTGPTTSRDNTGQLLAQMGLTIPAKKMSEQEIQDMIKQTHTLRENVEKEFQNFLQLDDQKGIDKFYTKMTKLVDYFPFVRQQQLSFGIDPRVDKEFIGVQ